jgi:hypothetical protein
MWGGGREVLSETLGSLPHSDRKAQKITLNALSTQSCQDLNPKGCFNGWLIFSRMRHKDTCDDSHRTFRSTWRAYGVQCKDRCLQVGDQIRPYPPGALTGNPSTSSESGSLGSEATGAREGSMEEPARSTVPTEGPSRAIKPQGHLRALLSPWTFVNVGVPNLQPTAVRTRMLSFTLGASVSSLGKEGHSRTHSLQNLSGQPGQNWAPRADAIYTSTSSWALPQEDFSLPYLWSAPISWSIYGHEMTMVPAPRDSCGCLASVTDVTELCCPGWHSWTVQGLWKACLFSLLHLISLVTTWVVCLYLSQAFLGRSWGSHERLGRPQSVRGLCCLHGRTETQGQPHCLKEMAENAGSK